MFVRYQDCFDVDMTFFTVDVRFGADGLIVGSCHDVEDEHFQCSDYDKYNLCNATSGLNFHLGHARCQKHCGFCPGNFSLYNFGCAFSKQDHRACSRNDGHPV